MSAPRPDRLPVSLPARLPVSLPARLPVPLSGRLRSGDGDAGQSTAEYAIATVAACGFGGVLWKILSSDGVAGLLGGLFEKALKMIV